MTNPKPVFFVGNKRSGSTLLVNMLNEHPEIGITHESDAIWILYQCRHGVPSSFRCFPQDASRGMHATITVFGKAIKKLLGPQYSRERMRSAFLEIQRGVLEQGTQVHKPLKSSRNLAWIGDKKPVQHASPELRTFILDHFADARFLHIIRHPLAVAASVQDAARTWPIVPDYWNGAAEDILSHWRQHEQWVLDLRAACPDRTCTIRLEDLCVAPVEHMSRLFAFLDLEMSSALERRFAGFVYPDPNEKHRGRIPADVGEVKPIMDIYGYSADISGMATESEAQIASASRQT